MFRRIQCKTEDASFCDYKSFPVYIPPNIKRPLYPDLCKCLSEHVDLAPDEMTKKLSLVDLIQESCAVFACKSLSNWTMRRAYVNLIGTKLDSLLFHSGQLEVLKNAKEQKKKIVITLDNEEEFELLCLLGCLNLIDRVPATISTEFWNSLPWMIRKILDKVQLFDPRSEEPLLIEDWGDLAVVSKQTLLEILDSLDSETLVVQCIFSKSFDGVVTISFSCPVFLQQLQFDRKDQDGISNTDVLGHINFVRNRLVQPNMDDCIKFIEDNKALFPHTDTHKSLVDLRDFIWQSGGDVAFDIDPLDGVQLPQQQQQQDCCESVGYSRLKLYFHVESVLAVAIKSLIPGPLGLFRGREGYALQRGKIVTKAEQLAEILGSKAVVSYPCESLVGGLFAGLNKLQSRGIIVTKSKTISSEISAVQARNLARGLDSDSDSEEEIEDFTKLDVMLTGQNIAALDKLASLIRQDLICVHFCLDSLPFLPIRLTDFSAIIKDNAREKRGMFLKPVHLTDQDVDNGVFSLVMSGVLERVDLRGEIWIHAKQDYCTERSIDNLLCKINPFFSYC